jgi:nucleotidyltransferase substrate binding protein (TIGR01987 family)
MQAHLPLDISSLRKALTSLQRGWERSSVAPTDEELRDACIQRFEFSFELSWKMIKRRLERDIPNPTLLDGMNFRELMRLAHEAGLIEGIQAWWVYRDMRNLSSHTYDAQVAAQVYGAVAEFLKSSHYLLAQLERKGQQDSSSHHA